MTEADAAQWLAVAWEAALSTGSERTDPRVDELCESRFVSIRYALLTQLLGKHADHRRDALCLQRGVASGAIAEGRWDPRGFSSAVVVPWVQATDNVLGNSSDPYVNKPLRRKRLDDWSVVLRGRDDWERLVALLSEVQARDDPQYTEEMLRRCLAGIARQYSKLNVAYAVPNRVSAAQCESVFVQFLELPSGGEAAQIAATALFRVIGRRFALFDEVVRQRINEADAASGAPGDIQCYQRDEERLVLAVEVKDRDLTLLDLNSSITKARHSGITELLFAIPGLADTDAPQIGDRIRGEWVQGTNVYCLSLPELLHVVLALAGEDARGALLREIGAEINTSAAQPELRARWASILDTISP